MKTNRIMTMLVGSMLLFGCSEDKPTLYVYSWSDYFDEGLIGEFMDRYDCIVNITSFDSNEQMYAKLKAGATGYDVIIPSSYQIPLLAKEGIIAPIDHSLIPNVMSNFNHGLDGQVLDRDMKWSVPYACTYTGLMVISNKVGEVDSWGVLGNDAYRGKISLLDDIRETIGIGLMYNGYSLNSTNETEIKKAVDTVLSWKRNVRKFDSESYKLEVADGSSYIGHGYSSDAAQVMITDERDDIDFVLPGEGFTIAWDEFVVTANSRNRELAHRFIDFFFENGNSYTNMLYICTLMANGNAYEKLPERFKRFLMPKNIECGQLLKCIDDQEAIERYNRAWDMIKATK